MKPNIYRFADVVDGTDVYEKIKDAIINNRMIPVLGSGFLMDLRQIMEPFHL